MNIDILNLYINKLKYCIITNKIIIDKINQKSNGMLQWLNTFKNTQIFNSRTIVNKLKDNDFDIIHINITEKDINLIDIIRNKLGDNSITKIAASFDSDKTAFKDLIKNNINSIKKADFLFCVEDYFAEKLEKKLKRKIYIIEHPENIKWLKLKNKNYLSLFLQKYSILKQISLIFLSTKNIKQFLKNQQNPDFDLFYLIKNSQKINYESLIKNKIIIINNQYEIDNRLILLFACLKIPLIGSNKIDIIRRCYPYTSININDKDQLHKIIKKIYKDKYFRNLVRKTAYDNSEYFNWKNSTKRLLFNMCLEIGNERFNSLTAFLNLFQRNQTINKNEIMDNLSNKKLNILGFNLVKRGLLTLIEKSKLTYVLKNHSKYDLNVPVMKNFKNIFNYLNKKNEKLDIISLTGEYKYNSYYGIDESLIKVNKRDLFGQNLYIFQSTFERSLIFNCYGLSPYPQGKPCYILILDDYIGNFYKIDDKMNIYKFETIITEPGFRYMLPFGIAKKGSNNTIRSIYSFFRHKERLHIEYLKPLNKNTTDKIKEEINFLLNCKSPSIRIKNKEKDLLKKFNNFSFSNKDIKSSIFKNFAWQYQKQMFKKYYDFAINNLKEKIPLLIGGKFSSHTIWNTRWKNSGIFPEIFISPCSGINGHSLGSAIDAQYYFSNNAKIQWDIYNGEKFITDPAYLKNFKKYKFSTEHVIKFLLKDKIIAWIQGKYDISSYGTCNRSIIACISNKEFIKKKNKLDLLEKNTPTSLACPEKDIIKYFNKDYQTSYNLFQYKTKNKTLLNTYKINRKIKIQTVSKNTNKNLYNLLKASMNKIGFPIIYYNPIIINKLNNLVNYIIDSNIDGMVINNNFYIKKPNDGLLIV